MYSAMSFRASPTSLSARSSSVVASAGTIFMTWFTITAAAAASSSPSAGLAARWIAAIRPRNASPSGSRRSTMPPTELESSIAAFRSVLSASF